VIAVLPRGFDTVCMARTRAPVAVHVPATADRKYWAPPAGILGVTSTASGAVGSRDEKLNVQ
jgi:hypothetical protein